MLVDYDCFLSTQTWPPLEPTPAIYSNPFPPPLEFSRPRSLASTASASSLSLTHYPILSPTISANALMSHLSGGAAAAQTPQQRRDTMFMPGRCKDEGEHGVKVMYLNNRFALDPRVFCKSLGNPECQAKCHQMHAWCARCDQILCQQCWGRSQTGYLSLIHI